MKRVLVISAISLLATPVGLGAQGRMERGYTGCPAPVVIGQLPTCSSATWEKVCVVHDLDVDSASAQAGKCKTAGANAGGGTYHGWCSCDKATGEWKIVGGVTAGGGGPETDPVYTTEKGAANGAATLDGATKVPLAQIPCASGEAPSGGACIDVETDAEALVHAGDAAAHHTRYADGEAVSAVEAAHPDLDTASADDCTLLTPANCPTPAETDPVALAQKGQIDGIAPLDGSGRVPTGNLPTDTSYLGSDISAAEIASGSKVGAGTKLPTTDALTPLRCLETDANGTVISSDADCGTVGVETDPVFLAQKGAVSGVATLDGSGLIPDAQIPTDVSRLGSTISTAEIDATSKNGTAGKVALTAGLSGTKCVETDANGNLVSAADVCGSGGGGVGGHTIRNDGGDLATRTGLHFSGSGVTVSDDQPNDETDVEITAGPNVSFNADGGAVESDAITALECQGNGLACSEPVADTARIELSIGAAAGQVAAGDHAHTGASLSGIDISDDTNLAVSAPVTKTDDTIGVSDASTTAKGVVELATSGEAAAGVVVQGDDARLSDTRTPTDGSVTAAKMADANHGAVQWGSGIATISPDAVPLGTATTGNYVGEVSCGTGISGCPAAGEGTTGTISTPADSTNQKVGISYNSSGTDVAVRKRINLIEGSNVTIDIQDDNLNNEADVTISATVATSGDAVSVDGAPIADPDFTDGGDINFTATGTPATVTASIKNDTVGLAELAGNNGTPQNFGDFTCTDASCLLETDVIGSANIANGGVANEDLANNSVTYAKMQDIGADTLVGREDVASGDPEEIAIGQGLSMATNTLSVVDADDNPATKGIASFDDTQFDVTSGAVVIASVAGVTGANEDDVSLSDVQTATSSDFHNIGGTDANDQCDDDGICSRIILDGTTCIDTSGDRDFHDTNCNGTKDLGEQWLDATCMEMGDCNPRAGDVLGLSVTAGECDGTAGECYRERSCNSVTVSGTDQGTCLGGTIEGTRCDSNVDCSGGSTCVAGDMFREGISCDGRLEQRSPDGVIRRYAFTDELGSVSYCQAGFSIIGNACQDDFTQAEADALFASPKDLAAGSTINGNDICYNAGTGCGAGNYADLPFLVTTATSELTSEVVVGATPGGDLGGTWDAPTIPASSITFGKIQDIATDTLVGRDTAGSGSPEAISLTAPLSFNGSAAIIIADADDDGVTKGVAAFNDTHFDAVGGVVSIASVAGIPGANEDNVTLADVQTATTSDFHNIGGTDDDVPESGDFGAAADLSATGAVEDVNCTGECISNGEIATGTIALAKLANISEAVLLGRASGLGTGAPATVTLGGGLEWSGTTVQRAALTGNVTAAAGNNATTIANNVVTPAMVKATVGATTGYVPTAGAGEFVWVPFSQGLRFESGSVDIGSFAGFELSDDFAITTDLACVGGDSPGLKCPTAGQQGPCGTGGICTADAQAVASLAGTVYRPGTQINASDMAVSGNWGWAGRITGTGFTVGSGTAADFVITFDDNQTTNATFKWMNSVYSFGITAAVDNYADLRFYDTDGYAGKIHGFNGFGVGAIYLQGGGGLVSLANFSGTSMIACYDHQQDECAVLTGLLYTPKTTMPSCSGSYNGLVAYDNDGTKGLCLCDGTSWQAIPSALGSADCS